MSAPVKTTTVNPHRGKKARKPRGNNHRRGTQHHDNARRNKNTAINGMPASNLLATPVQEFSPAEEFSPDQHPTPTKSTIAAAPDPTDAIFTPPKTPPAPKFTWRPHTKPAAIKYAAKTMLNIEDGIKSPSEVRKRRLELVREYHNPPDEETVKKTIKALEESAEWSSTFDSLPHWFTGKKFDDTRRELTRAVYDMEHFPSSEPTTRRIFFPGMYKPDGMPTPVSARALDFVKENYKEGYTSFEKLESMWVMEKVDWAREQMKKKKEKMDREENWATYQTEAKNGAAQEVGKGNSGAIRSAQVGTIWEAAAPQMKKFVWRFDHTGCPCGLAGTSAECRGILRPTEVK